MTAGEKLMEHTHRVYELDALLAVLDDVAGALRPTAEEIRRSHALLGIAARIAQEAVGVVDDLMEAEITWRERPIAIAPVIVKKKAVRS